MEITVRQSMKKETVMKSDSLQSSIFGAHSIFYHLLYFFQIKCRCSAFNIVKKLPELCSCIMDILVPFYLIQINIYEIFKLEICLI